MGAAVVKDVMCKINDLDIMKNARKILPTHGASAPFVSPNANFDCYLYLLTCVLNTR